MTTKGNDMPTFFILAWTVRDADYSTVTQHWRAFETEQEAAMAFRDVEARAETVTACVAGMTNLRTGWTE
jgi:hypothetical protein